MVSPNKKFNLTYATLFVIAALCEKWTLRMNVYRLVLIVILVVVSGCNESNEGDELLTPQAFKQEMLSYTSIVSLDCGEVHMEEDNEVLRDQVSSCASDAFMLLEPFHVFYRYYVIRAAEYVGYVYDGEQFYTGLYTAPDEAPPKGDIRIESCSAVIVSQGNYFDFRC